MESTPRKALTRVILVFIACALAPAGCEPRKTPTTERAGESAPKPMLDAAALAELSQWCARRWQGDMAPYPSSLAIPARAAFVAARQNGVLLVHAWGVGDSMGSALTDAFSKLGNRARSATALEIFLATESAPVDPKSYKKRLQSNIHRGIVGIEEVLGDGTVVRHSPSQVISGNRSHKKLLALGAEKTSASQRYSLLHGTQVLVDLNKGKAHRMERGNSLVAFESVTQASVAAFTDRLATWMWKNLHQDGRMTYLYWPSQGREAPGRDNLIRQFMATIALGRLASKEADGAQWSRSASNIDFNLQKYYREDGPLGLVELRGKVKLGSVALAALAIVEHRDRARWKSQEEALLRTVDSLWQEDGSFRTFHLPASRNDNQNFYPGEALLLWATLYAQTQDERLLDRFMRSFTYYRRWHLDSSIKGRRNPAFIPWHTQAYFLVWQQTRNVELRDFIFEMNDWLLDVQQWDAVRYPDTRGRFFAPDHDYGPPHASATGVYLESLIDAHSLAKSIGDARRTSTYAQAIRRALRSSMQLQFADDIDMFYISKRERVFGGLRTTVYDNQIRCDNVQHTLMGTLKILESGLLPPH